MTGRTLSHYRVAEEISRGGMGVVYRATDLRLNRDVALKVLPDELTHDAERKRRFIQEAQAASALEHPHIAVIHEVDEADGFSFIAMELIRGHKLSDLLAQQRLSPTRALELGTEIASGLGRAHETGIVHRDVKPANVMVTDEGHAKIIDFGIAKLIEPAGVDTAAETAPRHETGEGVVLGTAAYMSPEQARGEKIDHRSDIFSFGVLLHEMLSGQPPFRGKSSLETASAILREPAPRLPAFGHAVTPDTGAEIQRIVDKCLAKDPDDRYQGMKDAIVDLRAARRRLESTTQGAAVVSRAPVPRWVWAVAGLVVAAIAAAVLLNRKEVPAAIDARTGSTKPSVAVLYFDNTTGSPELDWLRTGITEMVVTDLSQQQDFEVVATDQLYEVMNGLKRAEDRVTSPEVIRAVAERTGVSNVIVGSYVKAGSAIRINVRLQEAKTGRIVSSERVEGPNEASLFAMVDDLSQRIRTTFQALAAGGVAGPLLKPPASAPPLDRGLGDVTTSSIEAYKHYAEGINLHERFREGEAAALFEKAIAIDPAFAMAYTKLAVVQNNLGHIAERDQAAAMALKLADRLTLRERYYIEGYYYSTRRETLGRSMDAYKKCVALDPGHQGCSHNLAMRHIGLQEYSEGIALYEGLLRRGAINPSTTGNLTVVYRALGQFDKARAAADTFVSRNGDVAAGYVYVGDMQVAAGEIDRALASYARAEQLDPRLLTAVAGRVVAEIFGGHWEAAEKTAQIMFTGADPSRQWLAAIYQTVTQILRGKSQDAMMWADRAARAYRVPGLRSGLAHDVAAQILLDTSQPAAALNEALKAVADTHGNVEERGTLVTLARAQAVLGRRADAEATIVRLSELSDPIASPSYRRELAFGRGLVALGSGDTGAAIDQLNKAQAELSPRGGGVQTPNPHVGIWYALATAYLAAGRASEAEQWFQKVADSGYERLAWPVAYVRSFYFLGQLHEARGDMVRARESYRRFVEHWKDGDIDRGRVAEAERKIRSGP